MRQVCGLDVHKDSVFACIVNENGVVIHEKFGVLTPELEQLASVLQEHEVNEVCMESTSIYWMPVWRVLEPYVVELKLVNPYFIKQLPGKKSDVKDAEWIATCLLKDLIRISNYVSTTDGKSYKDVVRLISEGIRDPAALLKVIHGRITNRVGKDVIQASLTGVISDTDIDVIRQLREEVDLAQRHKDECQSKMDAICQQYFPEQLKNLQTIPGVKGRSATGIIAEVGSDISSFQDAAHLVSWCGLKPRNEESAGKIKARSITHGNRYLRKTLIECAWAASKTQGCYLNKFSYYQTVVRRKNKMKVQVAIARKILTAVWYVLHDNVAYRDYNPDIAPAA